MNHLEKDNRKLCGDASSPDLEIVQNVPDVQEVQKVQGVQSASLKIDSMVGRLLMSESHATSLQFRYR
jgi:hypothetical protein